MTAVAASIARARIRLPSSFPLGAGLFCLLLVVFAVFGDSIAPHKRDTADLANSLIPPAWLEDGSMRHVLGTDHLGRDLLSRLIAGGQASLVAAAAAIFVAGTIGVALGLVAGYVGGVLDALLMRVVDAFLALPFILMALALVAAIGPGLENIVLVMIITNWARYARLVRSEVIALRTRDFVTLARVAGVRPLTIAFRHVLPNALNSVVVLAVLDVGRSVILESSLSFLGLGIRPPTVSWGSLLAEGKAYIDFAWWLTAFPGLMILFAVLSFNTLGQWLRRIIDPRAAI